MAAALNKMFATLPLPAANASPTEALRVYYEICQPYSTDDVELAVKQFLSGSVKDFNPNFAPSAPKFAIQLRANAEYRASINSSHNLLIEQFKEQELDEQWQSARSPEAKARVQSMLSALEVEQKAKPKEDPAKVKARVDFHDSVFGGDFYQAKNGQVISGSLLHRLGFSTFNAADDDHHDMGQAGAA
jgi:hypothetical protein